MFILLFVLYNVILSIIFSVIIAQSFNIYSKHTFSVRLL